MKFRFIAAGLLCALIAACGGGGEEGMKVEEPAPESAPKVLTPEGHWYGRHDGRRGVYMTVLENGEIWGTLASDPTVTGLFSETCQKMGHTCTASSATSNVVQERLFRTASLATFSQRKP